MIEKILSGARRLMIGSSGRAWACGDDGEWLQLDWLGAVGEGDDMTVKLFGRMRRPGEDEGDWW